MKLQNPNLNCVSTSAPQPPPTRTAVKRRVINILPRIKIRTGAAADAFESPALTDSPVAVPYATLLQSAAALRQNARGPIAIDRCLKLACGLAPAGALVGMVLGAQTLGATLAVVVAALAAVAIVATVSQWFTRRHLAKKFPTEMTVLRDNIDAYRSYLQSNPDAAKQKDARDTLALFEYLEKTPVKRAYRWATLPLRKLFAARAPRLTQVTPTAQFAPGPPAVDAGFIVVTRLPQADGGIELKEPKPIRPWEQAALRKVARATPLFEALVEPTDDEGAPKL